MKFLAYLALLPACALGGGSDATSEQNAGSTQYVGIGDFSGIDQFAWFQTADKVRAAFNDVCGDTFCEGDFANITPLTFTCAVSSKRGVVHDCSFTFAASQVAVDGGTAVLSVDAPTYECHIHPRLTATQLLATLSASTDPLHEALPGSGSIYDALGDCFDHPIGATALPTGSTATTYVEADAYYTSFAYQQRWRDAQAALVRGFDNVCGDTFCGGDFGDLRSIDLACAITKSSGNVKGCSWIFGGSYALVKPSGDLDVTSKSFACPVAMHGTLAQLITTLTAAGTEDPIRRPLPGTTATAYDALLGCLP